MNDGASEDVGDVLSSAYSRGYWDGRGEKSEDGSFAFYPFVSLVIFAAGIAVGIWLGW